MIKQIAKELKNHAAFTLFGALTGIIIMLLCYRFSSNVSYNIFYILYPIHARLGIAEENSGKLVTLVRKRAREIAQKNNSEYILIDGPPGIGCPVIASLAGVNLALVVSEPTLSGIHDLERIIDLTEHFKIKTLVGINKYDINLENVQRIEEICEKKSIKVIGKLPYDSQVNKAMRVEKTIIEYDPQSEIAQEITRIWNLIENEV